jgi:hypothetical protein
MIVFLNIQSANLRINVKIDYYNHFRNSTIIYNINILLFFYKLIIFITMIQNKNIGICFKN